MSGAVGSDRRDRDRDLKKAHTVSELFLDKVTGLFGLCYIIAVRVVYALTSPRT